MKQNNTNEQIRPLFLGLWAPPTIRPQAMLLEKMVPEWVRQGISPILVTYDGQGEWNPGVTRILIPQFSPKGIWRAPYFTFLAQVYYWIKTDLTLAQVLRKNKLNIIFSFANPIESNVIGALLSRSTGIPLVANFSDPMVSKMKKYTKLGLVKVRLLEKFIVSTAAAITVPDEEMKKFIMENYSDEIKNKFQVINHCYNPKDYVLPKQQHPRKKEKFVISHVGSFYSGRRTPEPLFDAIVSLLAIHPELRKQVEIKLVGGATDYGGYDQKNLEECIKKYNIFDLVQVIPAVDYRRSLEYMSEADCLVVIDMAVNYFLAMKVVDYAGADRPIIAITSHWGTTASVVSKLGHRAFLYSEPQKVAEYMYQIISGDIHPVTDQTYRGSFDVHNTTKMLLRTLQSAIAGK